MRYVVLIWKSIDVFSLFNGAKVSTISPYFDFLEYHMAEWVTEGESISHSVGHMPLFFFPELPVKLNADLSIDSLAFSACRLT